MKHSAPIVIQYWKQFGLPEPEPEYRFHEVRRWRLDYAWPLDRVGLEVQGGIFIQGRHTQGAALRKEHEKLNELACIGWRVLYVEPKFLLQMDTVRMIHRALRELRHKQPELAKGEGKSI